MSIIKKLSEFIVFSNLWIALCASGLTANTYFIFDITINFKVLLLVFLSTFSVYNLQRIVKHYFQKKNHNPRHSWIYKHNLLISISSAFTSVLSIIIFFNLFDFVDFLLLLPFSLISTFYAFTIFPKQRALRDLPFIKIFLIAITWAVCSVFLPFIDVEVTLFYKQIALFTFNFLFIIAITIPFDIRDLKLDSEQTKTIPQVFGINKSITASLSLLIACAFIAFFIQETILVPPLIICFILIMQSKKEMPELFYSGILDGTILLFPLISFIFC